MAEDRRIINEVKREKEEFEKQQEEAVVETQDELKAMDELIPITSVGQKNVLSLFRDYYAPETLSHLQIEPARAEMLAAQLKVLSRNMIKISNPIVCLGHKCHPAGTLIRTQRGNIKIEELKETDIITGWRQNSNEIVNPRKYYSHKIGIREYSGLMCKFFVGNECFDCTNDHHCIVKWDEKAQDAYGVYLMNRGNTWRIGYIKLFKNNLKNQSGLSPRCLVEQADRAWLLGIYENQLQAYMAEDYFSLKFKTSKMCFMATTYRVPKYKSNLSWVTQEQLDKHHTLISNPLSFYVEELFKLGLDYRYPFWEKNKDNRKGFLKPFVLNACNIFSGYMKMGLDIEPRLYKRRNVKAQWKTATKEIYIFNGPVYSLDVKPYHTYLANDVLTHNCYACERCPIQKSGVAPIGHACPIELMLIDQWEDDYINDLAVDKQSKVELDMVRDMIESDLIDWRASNELAKGGLFDWNAIGMSEDGKPIYRKEEAVAIGIKLKFKARKDRIREDLMATRKMRAKFGLAKTMDPSKFASALQERYNAIKATEVQIEEAPEEMQGVHE